MHISVDVLFQQGLRIRVNPTIFASSWGTRTVAVEGAITSKHRCCGSRVESIS